jgi:hypothetical protein
MSSANTAESPEALRAEVESLKAQLAAKKAELRLRKKQQPAASEGSTDDDADRSSADTDESSLADQPLADDAYTWRPRFRALATIVVLMAFAPIAAFLYVVACVFGKPLRVGTGRTVLVTGGKMTKSLHFVRWFAKAGYRVVLVETPKYWHVGARFSRGVAAFYTVTDPRQDPKKYVADLVEVAKKEKASFFVPVSSPVASVFDSEAKVLMAESGCRGLHFDPKICNILDNKHTFCEWARSELGLRTPESFLLTSNADVRELNANLQKEADAGSQKKFILKNLQYDAIHRLDLFALPCSMEDLNAYLRTLTGEFTITKDAPWQAQRFLKGQEYAAFAVLRDGEIRAFTMCKSSASQLNYEHFEHPKIREWVRDFAAKSGLTGQLCWDFIEDEEGVPYPIECNPRIHTQSCVFLDGNLGGCVLDDVGPPEPSSDSKPIYWFFNEFFKVLIPGYYGKSADGWYGLLRMLVTERDAQFTMSDPYPFIHTNMVQIPLLLLGAIARGAAWKKVDFAIGKVVELGGD